MGSIYFYFYKETLLYIGSSMDINTRIYKHKSNLKFNNTIYFYKYLRENSLTFENLELEEVKTEITDKIQLKILERKCQDLYEPLCNKNKAYLSEEEFKEYKKEYNKEYEKTDRRKEYKKEYNKEYQKEYQKTDKFKEYKKEYQKANRERINENQRKRRAAKKAEQQAKEN